VEVETKERNIGTTISMTFKNGLIVKYLSNGDILQSYSKSTKVKNGKVFDEVITENY